MTRQRLVLYGLLFVVAAAAAVLSFAALRDLALICHFDAQLAWLLPIVVDAGAAAGSLAWLGTAAPAARSYGRVLALGMLALSVAGNALAHGLAAYRLAPAWWVVVIVSAVAPATVFAMVHLLVLVGRPAAAERDVELDAALEWADRHAWRQRHGHAGQPAPDPQPTPSRPPLSMDDERIVAAAERWARDLGRPPSRDEMLRRFQIGAKRCRRLREALGWADGSTPADPGPTPEEADA